MNIKIYKKGFSLIELTLVMGIIAVLISGGLSMIFSQSEAATYKETKQRVEYIKELLLAFVEINGYLPCPSMKDTTSFGKEVRVAKSGFDLKTGYCTYNTGYVPYLAIGLMLEDVKDYYGHLIGYSVERGTSTITSNICTSNNTSNAYFCPKNSPENFFEVSTAPVASSLTSSTTYVICNSGIAFPSETCHSGSQAKNIVIKNAIAVIYSYNSNISRTCPSRTPIENENCDSDANYIKASLNLSKGNNFFDDYVTYISALELKSRIK